VEELDPASQDFILNEAAGSILIWSKRLRSSEIGCCRREGKGL